MRISVCHFRVSLQRKIERFGLLFLFYTFSLLVEDTKIAAEKNVCLSLSRKVGNVSETKIKLNSAKMLK